jgi:hypothetical protein
VGDEAQFRFGGERSSGLEIVVSKAGLENLVRVSTEALEKMRTETEELEIAETKGRSQ